jgi:hypothetical protein
MRHPRQAFKTVPRYSLLDHRQALRHDDSKATYRDLAVSGDRCRVADHTPGWGPPPKSLEAIL